MPTPRPLAGFLICAVLVLFAAGVRLLEFAPNFSAVGAAALCAGWLLRSRFQVLLVPILAMALSDLAIGGYDPRLMLAVYGAIAAPALLGPWLRARLGVARVAAAVLGGSVFFFIVTNLAVWALGSWYPRTPAGLVSCFVAALPFFKYTLLGDTVFTAVFFGTAFAVRAAARAMTPAYLGASLVLAPASCPRPTV